MIFISLPGMLVLLIPIIVAEALFIAHRTALKSRTLFWPATVANAASIILGVPLTWGVLLLCELGLGTALSFTKLGSGTWQSPLADIVGTILMAPWIAPSDRTGPWAVPLAALVLLVPFFFASVWIERVAMEHLLPVTAEPFNVQPGEVSERALRKAVWGANFLSYGFMFAFVTVWLVWGVYHR